MKEDKERKIHPASCDSDAVLSYPCLPNKMLQQSRAHQHHSTGTNLESVSHASLSCSFWLLSGHLFRLITVSTSLLFLLSPAQRYHIFLTRSSADRHLHCRHFHAIVNRAVMFLILCFHFWGHYFCGLKRTVPAEFVNM
jgi:hypothetical protein